MVRSIITYRHIKSLCSFFSKTRNSFRFIDSNTVAVVSGIFSGLVFEFTRELCRVKTNDSYTCFDLPLDFSMDKLVKILIDHNIIKLGDVEVDD
ncbi:hypothetical protein FFF34_015935 [Inquilinus sp. KBS0705]|nr:hypothetical protein FFF34_015935 [Inquilinus sp. KBS0705]